MSKIYHFNEKPSNNNNNNNNNNNIYTGGVLTLSGFRNGPVKNLFNKGQNFIVDGQTSKMLLTISVASQTETNLGKQK